MLRNAIILGVAAVMTISGVVIYGQVQSEGISLFVAPDGQDTNRGTKDKPFATLERARDEVRRLSGLWRKYYDVLKLDLG